MIPRFSLLTAFKDQLRDACSQISMVLKQGIGHVDGPWRGHPDLYQSTDSLSLRGVMDISVCWFAQGHEVSPTN